MSGLNRRAAAPSGASYLTRASWSSGMERSVCSVELR